VRPHVRDEFITEILGIRAVRVRESSGSPVRGSAVLTGMRLDGPTLEDCYHMRSGFDPRVFPVGNHTNDGMSFISKTFRETIRKRI
jgi:hypothetical protein